MGSASRFTSTVPSTERHLTSSSVVREPAAKTRGDYNFQIFECSHLKSPEKKRCGFFYSFDAHFCRSKPPLFSCGWMTVCGGCVPSPSSSRSRLKNGSYRCRGGYAQQVLCLLLVPKRKLNQDRKHNVGLFKSKKHIANLKTRSEGTILARIQAKIAPRRQHGFTLLMNRALSLMTAHASPSKPPILDSVTRQPNFIIFHHVQALANHPFSHSSIVWKVT